ncbi:hypothetical protein V3C99_003250 [Haemonchus contortus]
MGKNLSSPVSSPIFKCNICIWPDFLCLFSSKLLQGWRRRNPAQAFNDELSTSGLTTRPSVQQRAIPQRNGNSSKRSTTGYPRVGRPPGTVAVDAEFMLRRRAYCGPNEDKCSL